MNKILFIIFFSFFCMIITSCSTKSCQKKSCCPMEGHGRCPICFEVNYLDEIKNNSKNNLTFNK